MKGIDTIERAFPMMSWRIRSNGGFLTTENVQAMATNETTRLLPVIVRCGNGRFVCGAQDALHFVEIIERDAKNHPVTEETEYVRDISLPA